MTSRARSILLDSIGSRGQPMNCASCGAGLVDGATFCGACGAKVENAGVLRVTLDDLDSPTRDTTPTPAFEGPAAAVGAPPPFPAYAPVSGPVPGMYSPAPLARPRSGVGLVGAIIGVIGALTVIIGSLVNWIPDSSINLNAFKITFGYLTDYTTGEFTAENNGFGILLVALAVIGAATSFIPKAGLIRNVCGVGVLVVVILYLIQVNQGIQNLNDAGFGEANLGDVLGAGFYVTAVGGLLMAAGPPRW